MMEMIYCNFQPIQLIAKEWESLILVFMLLESTLEWYLKLHLLMPFLSKLMMTIFYFRKELHISILWPKDWIITTNS